MSTVSVRKERVINIYHIEDNPIEGRLIDAVVSSLTQYSTRLIRFNSLSTIPHDFALKPHLIFLDLGLQDSNGLDTLKQAKLMFPSLPIIIITCLDSDSVYEASIQHGAHDYIMKHELNQITIKRAITGALARSKAPYNAEASHSVLNSVHRPVLIVDTAGDLLAINDMAQEIVGYSYEEIMKPGFVERIRHPQHEETYAQLREHAYKGESFEMDIPYVNKTGETRWFRCVGTPLVDELGIPYATLYTGELTADASVPVHNLKKRKEHYKRMAKTLFKSMNSAKSRQSTQEKLIDGIVHDIRSPISSVKMMMEMTGDPPNFELLDPITWELTQQELNLVIEMCNQLLDIRRLESGTFRTQTTSCKVAETIRKATNPFTLIAAEREIKIKQTLAAGYWLTDHQLLMRIVMNLVDNALKHSETAGQIRINTAVQNGRLVIKVCDDGPGIPADKLEAIFELHATCHKRIDGRGIGLAFCKQATEKLGGSIHAENQVDGGARVIISLPEYPEEPEVDACQHP